MNMNSNNGSYVLDERFKMSPLFFSIIVPVYNVEDYLAQCLNSLLGQSYQNFEIILIDDGSTDSSGLLCDNYEKANGNISVYHTANGGLSIARNTGVLYSRGDYIIFVDSDDFVSSEMLENICYSAKINHMPDIIISNGWYTFLDNTKNISLINSMIEEALIYSGTGKEILETILDRQLSTVPLWSKAYKKDFWMKNNYKMKEGLIGEDSELTYKIILSADTISICPAFYFYRKGRKNSILAKITPKRITDYLTTYGEWLNFCHNMKDKMFAEKLLSFHAKCYSLDILPSIYYIRDKSVRKEVLDKAKSLCCYIEHLESFWGKLLRISVKIVGFENTCCLLNLMKRIKNIGKNYRGE